MVKHRLRYEVDQAVFERPGREAHTTVAQQAEVAKDIALAQQVVELTVAPGDLHRSAADIAELLMHGVKLKNGRAGLEVADLNLPGDLVQQLLRQPVKGRKAPHMLADFQQFRFHGVLRAVAVAGSRTLPGPPPSDYRKHGAEASGCKALAVS